jgi:hypothetical protein
LENSWQAPPEPPRKRAKGPENKEAIANTLAEAVAIQNKVQITTTVQIQVAPTRTPCTEEEADPGHTQESNGARPHVESPFTLSDMQG